MPDFNAILIHFAPELVLLVGLLVVLGYDLAVRGREGQQAAISVATLLAACAATFWLYALPAPEHGLFETRDAAGTVIRAGAFAADGFTHFFRLAGMLTAILVTLSGVAYLRGRTPFKGEFHAFVLSAALAMNLMAGANDLILVALAIEFLSISSYILTGFLRGDALSSEGGLKYLLYGSITSAAMLFGLTYLYGATGTTSLPAIAATVSQPATMMVAGLDSVIVPALILVMAGIGFKLALVPFHHWSPDAYQGAPTPVTAFLSVGPKVAGIALLLRFLTTVFGQPALSAHWLALIGGLAALTMIVGNVGALTQRNVKRLMAYSSIAQAGYMVIGLAAWAGGSLAGFSPLGSVLIYVLAYVFTNLGAFAVIIAVDHATGSSDLSAFDGLARRAPLPAAALTLFFLSLIGIPPLAGFVGKFAVFASAVTANLTALAVLGVLTGVVAAAYYFRVVAAMYFRPAPDGAPPVRVSPSGSFAIGLALAMTLLIGLFAEPFLGYSRDAAGVLVPPVEHVAETGSH